MHQNAFGGKPARTWGDGRKEVGVREAGVPAPSSLPTIDGRCKGRKADGSRCKASPSKGTRYCIGHLRQRGEA